MQPTDVRLAVAMVPLRVKYQVFISSTSGDLGEEPMQSVGKS
jgi:hypothetical protein